MDLRDAHQELLDEIREEMFYLTAGYPMTETGRTLESLSELFEALGICHLLTNLDTSQFRENLVRSGHARRYYLRRSYEEGSLNDHRMALSRCGGFLAALAAGDIALASEIAVLSPIGWRPNWEYEDDHCFFLFLHGQVLRSRDVEVPNPVDVLAEFEKAVENQPAPRLGVCAAILHRDVDEFGSALTALLEMKQAEIERVRPSVSDTQVAFWPHSYLSVEGLALLKTAELAGMSVNGDFPLCPPEARLQIEENRFPDFFAELEAAFAADRG